MNQTAADLVRYLLSLGHKQAQIADMVGVKQSSVNDWLNKGATPSSKNMDRLRAVVQANKMLVGSTDDSNIVELRRVSIEEEHKEEQAYLDQRQLGFSSVDSYEPSLEGGIPEIDVLVGAGHGAIGEVVALKVGSHSVAAHQVIDEWRFPDGYLENVLNVASGRSLILPVVGDSMVPTYQPGDRILVDLRQNEMTIDAVYVISDGESAPQIKRLQQVMFSKPRMVDIISDNAAHPAQRVELAQLTIIGRVAGKVSKQ